MHLWRSHLYNVITNEWVRNCMQLSRSRQSITIQRRYQSLIKTRIIVSRCTHNYNDIGLAIINIPLHNLAKHEGRFKATPSTTRSTDVGAHVATRGVARKRVNQAAAC